MLLHVGLRAWCWAVLTPGYLGHLGGTGYSFLGLVCTKPRDTVHTVHRDRTFL